MNREIMCFGGKKNMGTPEGCVGLLEKFDEGCQ